MNRLWQVMVVLALPLVTLAQNATPGSGERRAPYQPAVAAPSTTVYGGGGYYGGSGGGTAAGSALNGMSQCISAAGQYNLNTSAAAINMTEAQSNAMRNDVQAVNTFWEMRNIGKAQRAAERGPPPTAEQLARMARSGVPRRLTPSQMDPVSGRLNWPEGLQDPTFDEQRGQLDEVFAKWARSGALDYTEKRQVRETVDNMFDELKAKIRDIPPQVYSSSRSFLQSLVYAAAGTTL